MMQHPAGLPAGLKGAIGVTSAIQTIEIEYFGKPAHAAAAPCKLEAPIVGGSLCQGKESMPLMPQSSHTQVCPQCDNN